MSRCPTVNLRPGGINFAIASPEAMDSFFRLQAQISLDIQVPGIKVSYGAGFILRVNLN